jgi:hypothetical protein
MLETGDFHSPKQKRVGPSMQPGNAFHLPPVGSVLTSTACLILNLVIVSGVHAQEFKAHRVRVAGEIKVVRAADLEGDGLKEMLVSFNTHRENKMDRSLHVYGWSGQRSDESPSLRNAWQVSPEAVFWDTGPADGGADRNSCYFWSWDGLSELSGSGPEGFVPRLRVEAPVFVATGQEDEFMWLDAIRDWDGDGRVEALLPLGREVRFYRQTGRAGWEMADSVRLEPFPYYNNNILFGRRVGSYQFLAIVFYPLLEPADLNGDGRQDLIALRNGKGLCYLRGENGKLDAEPVVWDLEIRSEEEIIRRRATLSYRVVDLNRDGIADVVVHKIGMQFVSWSAETAIFLGRPDGLGPKEPDQRFPSRGFFSGLSVADLDGDGYADMTRWSVKMGVWSLVDIFLRKVVHLKSQFYYASWPEGFPSKATHQRDFDLHIDSDRADFIRGLVPNTEGDFNQDGLRDLVAGKGEDALGIYLGRPDREFASRPWSVLEAPGINYVSADDLDGDGREDLYGYQVEEGFSVLHVWLQSVSR